VVADLVLIALGIALQPFRLSAFILILSTEGGAKKGLGFILGWLICLVLVIAVVVLITGGGAGLWPVYRMVAAQLGWPRFSR
jgi:hypothetical protein